MEVAPEAATLSAVPHVVLENVDSSVRSAV